MQFLRDPQTGKKSLTATGLTCTLAMSLLARCILLYQAVRGDPAGLFVMLVDTLTMAFLAVYANKHIRLSKDGVDIDAGNSGGSSDSKSEIV